MAPRYNEGLLRLTRNSILSLAALAFLLASPRAFAPDDEKERRLFERNLDLTAEIVVRKPSAVYVTLGRSPTPVQVLMKVIAPESCAGVPLSLRDEKSEPIAYPLEQKVKEKLYLMLDRFLLPAVQQNRGKEIVLIDYFDTGDTLLTVQKVVAEYLKERGQSEKVSVFAFGANTEGFLAKATKAGVPAMAREIEGGLFDAYDTNHWKRRAAFPSFKPGDLDAPLPEPEAVSPRFQKLGRDYEKRLGETRKAQFAVLRAALAKDPNLLSALAFPIDCHSALEKAARLAPPPK